MGASTSPAPPHPAPNRREEASSRAAVWLGRSVLLVQAVLLPQHSELVEAAMKDGRLGADETLLVAAAVVAVVAVVAATAVVAEMEAPASAASAAEVEARVA